jgi:hypothetical protein
MPNTTVLHRLFAATLLTASLGLAACGMSDDGTDIRTWDEFQSEARREFEGHVSYVVDGDMPVSLDELRAFYDQQIAGSVPIEKSVVRRTLNRDDVWSAQHKRDLTYCIGDDFGSYKWRAVYEMKEATRAWEAVADVRFRYLPSHDAGCTGVNTAVTFAVRPWTEPGACSPFPSGGGCVPRTLVINYPDYDNDVERRNRAPNLSTLGVFRHELGHLLGLVHEHGRNAAGGCFEHVDRRELTAYDPGSVMHYPWCGGVRLSDWSITDLDADGIRALYGARHRAATPGTVAVAARHADVQDVVWIAPNGSVRRASWQSGAWTTAQLAPPGSAAVDGGISIVSRVPNHYEVVWIGPDGSVRGAWWYEGGAWNLYTLAPAGSASTTAGVTAISRISNSMDVFWVSPAGAVSTAWWYEGGGPWQRSTITAAGAASTTSGVLALSRIPMHLELIWPTPDGAVRAASWYEGAPWETRTVAGSYSVAAGATIGGIALTPETMKVLWVTRLGGIGGATWTVHGFTWQLFAVPDAEQVSTNGGVSMIARHPTTEEAYWVDDSGRVHGAYELDGEWASGAQIGADAARTTSSVASLSRRSSHQELFFITPAGGLDGALWDVNRRTWTRYGIAP